MFNSKTSSGAGANLMISSRPITPRTDIQICAEKAVQETVKISRDCGEKNSTVLWTVLQITANNMYLHKSVLRLVPRLST